MSACERPRKALEQIAKKLPYAIKNWTPASSIITKRTCDGITWAIGSCEGALEIHVGGDDTICPGLTCPISGPSEIRMRPCTALPTGSSFSWGGGNGPTCDAPNQFFYISTTSFSRRLTEKVHGPVTRAFYSWTQRQFATP